MGKYCSWPFMTNITWSCLPLMNGQYRDFQKQSCPANLSYHPILSHSVPFMFSQMAISLMLVMGWIKTLKHNGLNCDTQNDDCRHRVSLRRVSLCWVSFIQSDLFFIVMLMCRFARQAPRAQSYTTFVTFVRCNKNRTLFSQKIVTFFKTIKGVGTNHQNISHLSKYLLVANTLAY